MNTIKDLAKNWWLNLNEQECHNFRIKYPDFNIENIFYQEVILKWYVGKYGKVEFDYNQKEIRNIYLKEHTKEQPQYPIGGYAPGNYMCNCVICKSTFQGDKRAIQCEPCAIKTTTSQSVDNTIDVEERIYPCLKCSKMRTKAEGGTTFSICEDCWEQPKAIEDNVWEEARKEYFKYVSECRLNGVTYLDFFKWLQQHYLLIKK